jgi:hypothetical protein
MKFIKRIKIGIREIKQKNKVKEYLIQKEKENLEENGYKIYSQNDEDGIINYVFSKIKTKSNKFVEIGIEDGIECNTRNLVENFGWEGIMIDGNTKETKRAREFYLSDRVSIVNSIVTPNNINKFISEDVDLLSIDVDGSDYWLWKAVKYNPSLVIIEYNSTFYDKSITIPYSDSFRKEFHPDWLLHSAGLNAFIKLGKEKGYKFIYANGINAFFLRYDSDENNQFKELTFEEGYRENLGRRIWGTPEEQFNLIKDREIVNV